MFCGGCQVFQVGQAPSGPTVIRPLDMIEMYKIVTGKCDVTVLPKLHSARLQIV